jgi:nucleotide-binding universal stress UspA family protein
MYKKILIPVDGSEGSQLTLKHAAKLAEALGAEITVIHVLHFPAQLEVNSGKLGEAGILLRDQIKENVRSQIEEHAQEIIKKAREDCLTYNITFQDKLVWGEPANEIIQEAQQGKYDLIVIGSRGLSEIIGWVMGSVSQKVAWHAKCPVLVVR